MATTTTSNPNWIRATLASLLLAFLLKVGLSVPILSTFIFLGVLFTAHVVAGEVGGGLAILRLNAKRVLMLLVGIILIFVLRKFAGLAIGYQLPNSFLPNHEAGGIVGFLFGTDAPVGMVFEISFAVVAGALAFMAVNRNKKAMAIVGAVFGLALLVSTVQIALPDYAETYPTREEVNATLAENGGIVGTVKAALGWNKFPDEGTGTATTGLPVKAFLDPRRSFTRVNHPALYVLAADTTVVFTADGHPGSKDREWDEFPAGNYLVYPMQPIRIVEFTWWKR